MYGEYQVRLRHVQGDIGPFTLPAHTTIADLVEQAFLEWPADGALGPHKPSSSAEIRFISSGKFVDNSQTVQDIATSLGSLIQGDMIITLHLIIRPPAAAKGVLSKNGGSSSGGANRNCCGCVIS